MEGDHGSSVSSVMVGFLTAMLFNVVLGVGIVFATHLKSEAIAATAEEASLSAPFQCRYVAAGRLHQLEVQAADWQEAEREVCGAAMRDVHVPPLLARGYASLLLDPDDDVVLKAQRESCSCSDGETPPILQDIGIVEAPRLGTLPKQRTLPQIVNNPTPTEKNAVDPDAVAPETPPQTERKKDRKRDPDISKLLDATSDFDPARPANDREAVGSPDGSRTSTSATGRGDPYLQKIKASLDNAMNAPASIPKSELKSLKAKVWIKVGGNGAIWSWEFIRKSGNDAFDAMVERTMKRFTIGGDKTFPPPPEAWALKQISVNVDGSEIR